MNLSKSEYKALISNVEREFGLLLAKSEESEAKKDDEGNDHSVKDSITGEVEKETEDKVAQDKEHTAEDKKDEEVHEKDHEAEGAHGYDEGDMAELHKIYGSMGKSELELHKNILTAHHMAKCGSADMGKSEKAHVEVKAPVAAKAEVKTEAKAEVKTEALNKSEIDALKTENESLKKNVQDLLTAVEGFVVSKAQAPARKAITEIGVLGKSEGAVSKQLNKSEITSILDAKTRESLSNSDRDLINNYYSGKCSVDQIKHLLG